MTLGPPETNCGPLDEWGEKAKRVILETLNELELTDTGGCRPFYSPKEWAARGEKYGRSSHLIVVYDGGEVAYAFEYDHENYDATDKMEAALREVGLYFEPCTNWYSAIYRI